VPCGAALTVADGTVGCWDFASCAALWSWAWLSAICIGEQLLYFVVMWHSQIAKLCAKF
jgi:hypothetical protein